MKKQPQTSSKLWDGLWKNHAPENYASTLLKSESHGIRWQRIKKTVIKNHKSFKNLRVIEIGAGTGVNSLLMAKQGARVTILDYSEEALKKAKKVFKNEKTPATFVLADAFHLPKKHLKRYDIAMSFGLAEHFLGKKRQAIFNAHFNLLNKNGIAIISVPNSWNLPYRVSKFIGQMTPYWKVGGEYPFTRKELKNICKVSKVTNFSFIGDSLITSLNFINPFWIMQRVKKKPHKVLKKEIGTPLDEYLSYSLVLVAKHAI